MIPITPWTISANGVDLNPPSSKSAEKRRVRILGLPEGCTQRQIVELLHHYGYFPYAIEVPEPRFRRCSIVKMKQEDCRSVIENLHAHLTLTPIADGSIQVAYEERTTGSLSFNLLSESTRN